MYKPFITQRQVNFASLPCDQNSFYASFQLDLHDYTKELLIESPFITTKRVNALPPVLEKLRKRDVQIVINTRSPEEHEGVYQE